jgi:hypothetical protein
MKWAEHLGARPEIGRSCMEIGKRLLETNTGYLESTGPTAVEYLQKARLVFKEINLEQELPEL